ncbi:MAG TPA: hypothetical protein VKA05_09350 [Acidimicrobiales bacterium]|nr:hypothetical protein [Acidimicrobiales bacterium]
MPTEAGGSGRWSTPSYLREVQYATPSNLSGRQALYAYRQPRLQWYDWVLDVAELEGDESILDVGCGNGHAGRIVSRTIAAEGAFRISTAGGCLVCR